MNVCKCIVPSQHGDTLNSHRATSLLVRLVEGEERWQAPDYSQGVLSQNWSEAELSRLVSCMVLNATVNGRRHLALCQDEFRGPRSSRSRSSGIITFSPSRSMVIMDISFTHTTSSVCYPKGTEAATAWKLWFQTRGRHVRSSSPSATEDPPCKEAIAF
ncbi:uncharacterized protein TNCV_2339421 [Trichonephila clavipes]|nr:uncharacterized protein TNCV_2339421 [Trichonephila clavipes]